MIHLFSSNSPSQHIENAIWKSNVRLPKSDEKKDNMSTCSHVWCACSISMRKDVRFWATVRISVWLPADRSEGICLNTSATCWHRWLQEFHFSGESLVSAEHSKLLDKPPKVGILAHWNIFSSPFAQQGIFLALDHDQQDVIYIHLQRSDTWLLDTHKQNMQKKYLMHMKNWQCQKRFFFPAK